MLSDNYQQKNIPEWADFFSHEQYESFINYVQTYFSGQHMHYSFDEGAIISTDRARDASEKMGLLNLAQFCRFRPDADWENLIRQHFDGLRSAAVLEQSFSAKAHDFEAVKDYIGVRIYPDEYAAAIKDGLTIGRSLADGIYAMLVFDFPNCVVNVRPEQTIQWKLSNDELFEFGIANTKKKYPLKMTKQVLDGVSFHLVVEDHYYTPNILFDLEKMDKIKSGDGLLVGVPNRHAVLIHPVKDLRIFQAINRMIPAICGMYKDGPGSVSEKLYWLNGGVFIPLPYTIDSENINLDPPVIFLRMLESLNGPNGMHDALLSLKG